MKSFTFVHAADLHIGSPFKGVSAQAPAVAQQLREATLRSYQNIIDTAISSDAAFVVLAGDIYDSVEHNLFAQLAFVAGLNKLAERGIAVYVAHGNHDSLSAGHATIEFPKNTIVFSEKVTAHTVRSGDAGEPLAMVAGISYPQAQEHRNLARLFGEVDTESHSGLFKIAVLHCNVGGEAAHANYAPCTVADLLAMNFDYWALGHVHERKILSEHPAVVYPGNAQGRNIRECGARGCYVVTVRGARDIDVQFKATDVVRWASETISIAGVEGINELETRLLQTTDRLAAQAEGRGIVCRLALTGRGSLYHQLRGGTQLADLLEHCRARLQSQEPFRWIEQIDFGCLPDVDMSEAMQRQDLAAMVLREAETLKSATMAAEQVQTLLDTLYNHSVVSKLISPPTPERLQELVADAAGICYDKLENS